MNSPLVIETAKKIVALPEFQACQDEAGRVGFLYGRIWQRPPRADELKLGLAFVNDGKPSDKVAPIEVSVQPISNDSGERNKAGPRFAGRQQFRKGGGGSRRREPLKVWEEYAHALLQANETSFLN